MSPRHTRQERLRDVGEEGQRRIEAGHVEVVGEGLRGETMARYLAGAGIRTLGVDPASAMADAARRTDPAVQFARGGMSIVSDESFGIDDPSCRALAGGAFDALCAIRSLLLEAPESMAAPTER